MSHASASLRPAPAVPRNLEQFPELHPPLDPQSAIAEANRCLFCFDAPCTGACVVSADGSISYLGRIDNLYSDFGKRRYEPTVYDLRDALRAIAAGRVVSEPRTKAIGCPI